MHVLSPMICPKCAGVVPLSTIWMVDAQFYCSEDCAHIADKERPNGLLY